MTPLWVEGPCRSGKTAAVVAQFQDWVARFGQRRPRDPQSEARRVLVFAADGRQRQRLDERLLRAVGEPIRPQRPPPKVFCAPKWNCSGPCWRKICRWSKIFR
ncbi:MAG: hypothetical protein HC918_03545 [Oscillatoriales cyanobacterium SM2_1_8]|nr:hypothetical protein [Oscillatoriales cyanobacterium SM2_1_8]